MDDESRDLAPPSEVTSGLPILQILYDRLAHVETPDEAERWVQLIGQVIQQEEYRKDQDNERQERIRDSSHLRSMERLALLSKVGLSVLAIGTGAGRAVAGHFSSAFLFWVLAYIRWHRNSFEDSSEDPGEGQAKEMEKANSIRADFLVALLLILVTVVILVLVDLRGTASPAIHIAVLISGMTTMGALVSLQHIVGSRGRDSRSRISFDENRLIVMLRSLEVSLPEPTRIQSEPWNLTAGQLVGIDNALALARLRMDLENELRRIAQKSDIDLSVRPIGIMGVSAELEKREVLPSALVELLREVAQVSNRAVHGEEIPDNKAEAIVSIGTTLLERLRSLPAPTKHGTA